MPKDFSCVQIKDYLIQGLVSLIIIIIKITFVTCVLSSKVYVRDGKGLVWVDCVMDYDGHYHCAVCFIYNIVLHRQQAGVYLYFY